jgi:hypothetical protein
MAGDVELPSVINAAQTCLLIAPEVYGSAAVRAVLCQKADFSGRIAEGDEVFP